MEVPALIFIAMHWGGTALVGFGLIGLGFAIVRAPFRNIFVIFGSLAALAFYMWFKYAVIPDTLAIYTVKTCEKGSTSYRLPFGDAPEIDFDREITDGDKIRTVINNQTELRLIFEEAVYTDEDVRWGGAPVHDGYVIQAGQTHGFDITYDTFNFLKPNPELIETSGFDYQIRKYSVECGTW